jgi:LysM repeat protein
MTRRIFQLLAVLAILVASFAPTSGASAWSGCPNYITVQWGDTLSGIAQRCGTTVSAIQSSNPGLGWWVYAGQVLYIPSGYDPAPTYNTYVVQSGDTLGKIAARIGVSWRDILACNPQIQNPSLIYAGQVINLPTGVVVPPPVYTPPPPDCTCCNCQPDDGVTSWATLKINYGPGMFIRSEPGGPVLLASAMDKTTWYYKLDNVIVDKKWRVWVEVKLYPPVKGNSTGWLLVRDQFGKYYTKPSIDG